MSWWKFWKKKQVFRPYRPQGRIGTKRIDSVGWYAVIVVEEVGQIGNRSRIKILEVNVDRDTNKNKDQILRRWGVCDWVLTNQIRWETVEQRHIRNGGPPTFTVEHTLTEPEEIEYRNNDRTLTRHNFITEEDG